MSTTSLSRFRRFTTFAQISVYLLTWFLCRYVLSLAIIRCLCIVVPQRILLLNVLIPVSMWKAFIFRNFRRPDGSGF